MGILLQQAAIIGLGIFTLNWLHTLYNSSNAPHKVSSTAVYIIIIVSFSFVVYFDSNNNNVDKTKEKKEPKQYAYKECDDLASDPEDPANNWVGIAPIRNPELAITSCQKAITDDAPPSYSNKLHHQLARAYFRANRKDEACGEFRVLAEKHYIPSVTRYAELLISGDCLGDSYEGYLKEAEDAQYPYAFYVHSRLYENNSTTKRDDLICRAATTGSPRAKIDLANRTRRVSCP